MSLRGLALAVTDIFFDRLAVENAGRVPLDRPVILAANHHSGLMDAMMLYASTPRDLRAVGKSTLWKIWPLRPFLAAGRVIPIYRQKDGGGDNAKAFEAVTEALVDGGAVGIFAEGISHDGHGLERIRTGAARMALDAVSAGAQPVIVPVGLIFEDRERFRSDALVRFGQPIEVVDSFPNATSEDRESVRTLTEMIEQGLVSVAPTWASAEHRAAARTAALHELPVGSSLAEIEAEAERLAAAGPLPEPDPRLVGERGEATLLVNPGEIDDDESALLRPFALAGKVANRPPFMVVDWIASTQKSNIRATVKAGSAAVLYPAWWAAIAAGARRVGMTWNASLASAGIVAVLGAIGARELPVATAEKRTKSFLRDHDREADVPAGD